MDEGSLEENPVLYRPLVKHITELDMDKVDPQTMDGKYFLASEMREE